MILILIYQYHKTDQFGLYIMLVNIVFVLLIVANK